jgi:hypothetical protein
VISRRATCVLTLALATLGGATACSGASGGGSGSTSTHTSGSKSPSKSASPSASPTTVSSAVSSVKGRKFDAGTIVKSKTQGGLTVLVLDRWTVKGVSDAKLATSGVPITPHSDTRFFDQNHGKTYTIPVNPSAPIVKNICTDKGGTPTMTSTPETLKDFLSSPNRTRTIVILSYDDSGRLIRLDTDPSC